MVRTCNLAVIMLSTGEVSHSIVTIWGVCMKKRGLRAVRGIRGARGIKHCGKCKEGRLIELKPRGLVFCGFCGSEFRI